jgi:hypothetical protein
MQISLGNLPLNLFLISFNQLDTLHDGQRDRKVLVRVDVSEPVFDRGGKLDLLEHVFACLLEDELDHFLRVHAQESLAAFGVAVPLADYLVDDAPMAAELEVLFVRPLGDGPLDRVQLGRNALCPASSRVTQSRCEERRCRTSRERSPQRETRPAR